MTTTLYVKAPPGHTLARKRSPLVPLRRALSAILLTLGIASFTSVIYPMMVYQYTYASRFRSANLITPRVQDSALAPGAGIQTASADEGPRFLPEMINTSLDYTNSEVWFPQAQANTKSIIEESVYTLSIPALKIDHALVKTGSQDLKESLIHYPGTARAGDLGNAVVFGHSVLPQFFDPTNYISIFSTLHTLDKGDTIVLDDEGATYTYQIYDMYEVSPDDLTPLAQTYDDRRLTLITCTPPGTYLRRLILKARLI